VKHLIRLALLTLLVLGCAEDGADGPMGASGTDGGDGIDGEDARPGPFKLMIAGAADSSHIDILTSGILLSGAFPVGMEVASFDVSDSTPTLAELQPYDVVLAFSDIGFDNPVALGNVLADYVDAGGRVAVAMHCYNNQFLNLAMMGRITTSPYLPATPSSSAGTWGAFDVSSIPSPAHPMFHSIGVEDFSFAITSGYRVMGIRSWGTLLASDTNGNRLVVINSDETVISLAFYPPFQFDSRGSDGVRQVIANALAFLAGTL